jgi:hypothetical protein
VKHDTAVRDGFKNSAMPSQPRGSNKEYKSSQGLIVKLIVQCHYLRITDWKDIELK